MVTNMANAMNLNEQPVFSRRILLLGVALTLVGIAIYAIQIAARRLTMPWYLPTSATVGALLVAVSLWRARSVWRVALLLLLLLLAGAEWAFLLATRLPPYTGPIAVGKPFPAFTTTRADGTPFTQRDLQGDTKNVLVFFRGRW
jgi:hypothetical protein